MNRTVFFNIIVLELAFLLMSLTATAEMALLPEVTFEMTNPAYWAGKSDMPDSILTDASTIEALNSAFQPKSPDPARRPEESVPGRK